MIVEWEVASRLKVVVKGYRRHSDGLRIDVWNDGHGAHLGFDWVRSVSGGLLGLVRECRLCRDGGN